MKDYIKLNLALFKEIKAQIKEIKLYIKLNIAFPKESKAQIKLNLMLLKEIKA